MPNFPEDLLSAYLDGELPGEERARVEQWLAESPSHRRMFDDLQAIRRELQALPRQKLDAGFCDRVLAVIRERTETPEQADVAGEVPSGTTSDAGILAEGFRPSPKDVLRGMSPPDKDRPRGGMPGWRWFAAGVAATLASLILILSIAPERMLKVQVAMSSNGSSAAETAAPRSDNKSSEYYTRQSTPAPSGGAGSGGGVESFTMPEAAPSYSSSLPAENAEIAQREEAPRAIERESPPERNKTVPPAEAARSPAPEGAIPGDRDTRAGAAPEARASVRLPMPTARDDSPAAEPSAAPDPSKHDSLALLDEASAQGNEAIVEIHIPQGSRAGKALMEEALAKQSVRFQDTVRDGARDKRETTRGARLPKPAEDAADEAANEERRSKDHELENGEVSLEDAVQVTSLEVAGPVRALKQVFTDLQSEGRGTVRAQIVRADDNRDRPALNLGREGVEEQSKAELGGRTRQGRPPKSADAIAEDDKSPNRAFDDRARRSASGTGGAAEADRFRKDEAELGATSKKKEGAGGFAGAGGAKGPSAASAAGAGRPFGGMPGYDDAEPQVRVRFVFAQPIPATAAPVQASPAAEAARPD